MELQGKSEDPTKYLTTLRSPVSAIKKRSGPLDDALDKLNNCLPVSQISSLEPHSSDDVNTRKPTNFVNNQSGGVSFGSRLRRCSTKDKERKRERWLLTRKTWRYMKDAGRKLVTDGSQPGSDNIDFIEEQFQRVCLSEPSFILWSRRTSYPGAISSSKRRLKLLSRHTSARRTENKVESTNSYYNEVRTLELLQTYLELRDVYKTTTLLGTKTVRPDQTSSPSAQRPTFKNKNDKETIISLNVTLKAELVSRLKLLSKSFMFGQEGIHLEFSDVSEIILDDKVLLKKIYSTLKKQQLHRILHSKEPSKNNANRSTSLSNLSKIGNYDSITSNQFDNRNSKQCLKQSESSKILGSTKNSLYLDLHKIQQSSEFPKQNLLKGTKIEKSLKTCGTQTSFIQLSELKSLAAQYKLMIGSCDNNLQHLEELDKQDGYDASSLSCRKSSIDEDISQSVSDTIKRYLKMARKKSVQDSESNRFKSINYDKNLRNIKAKGEINPPGMNEGLNKAVQTLNAWALIALDFIKGNECSSNLQNAHLEWTMSEDLRVQKKLEWEKSRSTFNDELHSSQIISRENNSPYLTCTSAPTSPTSHSKLGKAIRTSSGLLSSSSQFISNILHGHNNAGFHINTLIEKCPDISQKNVTANMQKSKSLSNVGQFVTKKIWRGRSKSQNRQNISNDTTPLPALKWYPSEHFVWISESGERFKISETLLINLSKTESDLVQEFALEKIKEFNFGNIEDLKITSHKRQIVPKKKSLTTSFFDIGRKDAQNGRIVLFGTSLESCLARGRNQNNDIENRSKYSLMSVFRGSDSNPGSVMKLNDHVRSCESLPSKCMDTTECFGESFTNSELRFDKTYQDKSQLMVPMFVKNCIEYLEENGLQKVGLFRVSTSKKRVKQLRDEFDKDCHMKISVDTCPHDVATLLKEYLRDLPEPLLCDRLYLTFLKTQRIRNRRLQLEAISHLIRLLPIPHRDTLYALLIFLTKVAAHSDDLCNTDGNCLMIGNKMDSNNLATVFAPNILRSTLLTFPRNKEQEYMSDAINVVRTMIDHYEEIFKISAELLNIIYTQVLESCPEKLYEIITSKINGSEWCDHIDNLNNIDLEKRQEETKGPNKCSQINTYTTKRSQKKNMDVLTASFKISVPEKTHKESLENIENKTTCQKLSGPMLPATAEVATLDRNVVELGKKPIAPTSNYLNDNNQAGIRKKTYKRQHLISSSRRINQGP
ncbi:uncharacterized protein LOC108044212 isoform X3 [Drosophila rhopaloa]|uniref:Rho-GAP domain-containing protein n=1 Tax=Drosophila rhopaloa TaxID=1041015 RepID=A0ABM5HDA1_DRORH|nr:uncharacterized protein LOC108044212 isoform X3 [Drosophila rhopaloa]